MEQAKVDLLMGMNKDTLLILLNEAEKRFDYIDSADSAISSKATNLVGLSSAVVFSLSAYICQLDIRESDFTIVFCCIIVISFLSMSIYFMYKVARPSLFYSKGVSPSIIVNEKNTPLNASEDEKQIRLLRSRIYNIELDIIDNNKTNEDKSKLYNKSTRIAITGMAIATGVCVGVRLSDLFILLFLQ